MKEYDYIIIGSGASGAAVAEKISSEYEVLVLEKGNYLKLSEAHKGYFKSSLVKISTSMGKLMY